MNPFQRFGMAGLLAAASVLAPWAGARGAPLGKEAVSSVRQYSVSGDRKQILFGPGLVVNLSNRLPDAFLKSGYFRPASAGRPDFTTEYYDARGFHLRKFDGATVLRKHEQVLAPDDSLPPHPGNRFYIPLKDHPVVVPCFAPGETDIDIQAVTATARAGNIAVLYRHTHGGATRIRTFHISALETLHDVPAEALPEVDAESVDWLEKATVLVRQRSRKSIGSAIVNTETGKTITTKPNILVRSSTKGIIARPMDENATLERKVKSYVLYPYSTETN